MATHPEPSESLKERARRVLADNPDAPDAGAPEALGYADLVEMRLKALRQLHETEPRRACCADRVRDLSRTLAETSGDSIHYRSLLEKLREAHDEWLRLEEKVWAARHLIRSTQWLLQILSDAGPEEVTPPAG